jgi:hypothetical protein
MADLSSWTENLRCPACGTTGQASLAEITQFNNRFDLVPDGFKVIAGEFHCNTCNIRVAP